MAQNMFSEQPTASYAGYPAADIPTNSRMLRLLVTATGPRDTSWAQALVVRLSKHPLIETRAIVDEVVPRLMQTTIAMENSSLQVGQGRRADDVAFYQQKAFELVEWADMMVCVPLDADGISKMLAGICDTLLGEVLRGWDTQKSIIMVPGMSTHVWSSRMTKNQLSEIHRKWNWITVLSPILWHYEGEARPRLVPTWDGFNEVLHIVNNQAELTALGRDAEIATTGVATSKMDSVQAKLPPEIWTMIFDYLGDWELAKALGVWTNLSVPSSWTLHPKDPEDPLQVFEHDLEWAFLRRSTTAICKKLSAAPPNFRTLSALMVKLTIRFVHTDVLAYLEANRPDLLKVFGGDLLPTRASACYPRIEVLNYWKQSKFFMEDQRYSAGAMDGASRNGHVRILDWWWRESGLPLRYTEAALEEATVNGHQNVLEWWHDVAAQDEKVVLRPGRALPLAAQHGRADILQWWVSSGISAGFEDEVLKQAGRHGQIEAMETWRRLKGAENLLYSDQELIIPTVKNRIDVLEWWRQLAHGELPGMNGHGRPVGFLTHQIEAAISVCPEGEDDVRQWWEQHGLVSGLSIQDRVNKIMYL